jgi:hypothetical protein
MIGARALAASCFVWAAFDLPTWGLDRAGVALLGLAFVALALAPRARRAPAPPMLELPGFPPAVPDDADVQIADLVARVQAASSPPTTGPTWGAGVQPTSSSTT